MQQFDECHHVFLAPSAGTSAAAYIEEAGVIVSIREVLWGRREVPRDAAARWCH